VTAAFARAHLGEGSICVFEGEPGVGKTTLLEAAGAVGAAEGVQVLAATCIPLERDFTYGVALQLFEQRLAQAPPDESEHLLGGAAGLAAPLLLGARGLGQSDERRGFSVDHGLYWLCSNLAETGPLALIVDDARWADPATLRFFAHLAQRIRELPVVLILGWRTPDSVALRELAAHPATTTFRLRPLTSAAVSRLLRESLLSEADPLFAKACHDATAGNPFLLQELITELGVRGIEPTSEGAGDVASIAPGSITNSVLLRLRRIGDGALTLARAVAVLGGHTEIRRAAELAQIPQSEATEIAHSLIEAEVLAPDKILSFVHPIVQGAVYHERSEPERAEAHRRAAQLLHREHAPAGQVAAHLLSAAAAADRWVVDVLLAEAAEAMSGGAPDSAVRLLERALREPPEPDQRAAAVLALGRAEVRVASPQAVDRLRRALVLMDDPQERASAALDVALLLFNLGRPEEALSTMEDALADDPGLPGVQRTRLEAGVAASRRTLGRGGTEGSRLKIDVPEDAQQTAEGRFLTAQLAYEAALEGRAVDEVRALATRALAGGALLKEETADGVGFYLATQALTMAEDFEAAELALGAAVEDARRRGSVLGYASASCYRGIALLSHGRVEEAGADMENCLAGQRYGWARALPTAYAALAECQIERGDLGAAERTLNLGGESGPGPEALSRSRALAVRGHLRLVTGRYQEAIDDLLEGGRRQELLGGVNPAVFAWRSLAAVAMAGLGDRGEGVGLAEEELRLARAFGAPGVIGNSLRVLGTVSTTTDALETLEEAVRVLEGSQAELRRAQAYVDFGSALRRAGRRRDARGPLVEGLGLSGRCGARSLARRARQELIAAGGRPRRPAAKGLDSLTPREHQTALLAAEGRSNREIAESMFVTLKTVEWHLGNTYDKLGVSSRSELESILLGTEKV
jgi:DNA-binding CsgD family transcriptional regulator/tetratricopeptide (TPR) repeat protein